VAAGSIVITAFGTLTLYAVLPAVNWIVEPLK
jgi:hypothetical protein